MLAWRRSVTAAFVPGESCVGSLCLEEVFDAFRQQHVRAVAQRTEAHGVFSTVRTHGKRTSQACAAPCNIQKEGSWTMLDLPGSQPKHLRNGSNRKYIQ